MESSSNDSMSEDVPVREINEDLTMDSDRKKAPFDPNTKITTIEITGYKKSDKPVFGFTNYQIVSIFDLLDEKETHQVERRYSDFRWLYKYFASVPGLFLPSFPPKDLLNNLLEEVIQTRKRMFQKLLTHLAKLDSNYLKNTLIPFLTLSTEEFVLHKREFPILKNFLPAKPSGIFSFFSSSVPKMSLSPLRDQLADIKVADETIPFEEQKLTEKGELAVQYSKSFQNLCKTIMEAESKVEEGTSEMCHARFRIEEVAVSEEFEDFVSVGSKTVTKSDERKENAFKTVFEVINSVLERSSSYFSELTRNTDIFCRELELFGFEFLEIERLAKQHLKIMSDLNQAEVLISEYKGKIIYEKSLNKKKQYETLISSLKEFKELKEKSLKIFASNFRRDYEIFNQSRKTTLERIVKNFVEGQRKVLNEEITNIEDFIGSYKDFFVESKSNI